MERVKNYIILGLSIALLVMLYINTRPIEDAIIVTENKTGEAEEEIEEIVRDTIFIEKIIPGQSKPQRKEIVVDSTYKADYEKAIKENDSLKAKNLFLESISLDTWDGNLVDNKDININGKFLTRGKLLEYKIDYKIKSDTLTFKPNIEYRHPKASFVYGVKLGLPMRNGIQLQPTLEGVVGFQNKKGSIITFSADTQNRFSIGYYKTITLFK